MTNPNTDSLTYLDRQVLSWIEVTYHQTSAFPTFPVVKSKWPRTFPTQQVFQLWLERTSIKQALQNRGLRTTNSPDELTEAQAAAILLVANLADKRSTTAKLKSLGISLAQWNAWKKLKGFQKFLHDQLSSDFETSLDRVFQGLLNSIDKGDPRAVQLYLELTGRQPTADEKNYRLAISRIMESLNRHVKDQATLQAIANDFQLIGQGIDPLTNLNPELQPPEPEPQPRVLNPAPSKLGSSI